MSGLRQEKSWILMWWHFRCKLCKSRFTNFGYQAWLYFLALHMKRFEKCIEGNKESLHIIFLTVLWAQLFKYQANFCWKINSYLPSEQLAVLIDRMDVQLPQVLLWKCWGFARCFLVIKCIILSGDSPVAYMRCVTTETSLRNKFL